MKKVEIEIGYFPDLETIYNDTACEFEGFIMNGQLVGMDPKYYPPMAYGCEWHVVSKAPRTFVEKYKSQDFDFYIVDGKGEEGQRGLFVPKNGTELTLKYITLATEEEQDEFCKEGE